MSIRVTVFSVISFSWLLSGTSAASPGNPIATDVLSTKVRVATSWLQKQVDKHRLPGGAFAVIDDQTLVLSSQIGLANRESGTPVTADTQFPVCSVSKLFTSLAIMQLRDKGKFDIDAPITEYLPWLTVDEGEGGLDPVTARSILTHVSGLPREAGFPYWTNMQFPTREEVLDILPSKRLGSNPFEVYQYSNLAFVLLGEIVAAVSGRSYHDYVVENILDPLEMADTTTEIQESAYGEKLAVGYYPADYHGNHKRIPFYSTNAIASAAGFTSTQNDLAKFAMWMLRSVNSNDNEVLKSSTLREMQRVQWADPDKDGGYAGLGFRMRKIADKTLVGHGGHCPGYRTALLMRVDENIAVLTLLNSEQVNPDQIVSGLYGLLGPALVDARADASESARAGEEATKALGNLKMYEGIYAVDDYPQADTYIAPVGDELIVVSLHTDDPAESIAHLQQTSEHRFRMVRDDGSLAEEWRFEVSGGDTVERVWFHDNYLERQP